MYFMGSLAEECGKRFKKVSILPTFGAEYRNRVKTLSHRAVKSF